MMNKQVKFLKATLIVVFTLFITHCGYQLRGFNNNTTLNITSIIIDHSKITMNSINDRLIHRLTDEFKDKNIQVYTHDNSADSTNKITLNSAFYSKNITSTASNKIISQFKIVFNTNFNYHSNNKLVISKQPISVERNYNYTQEQILGLDDEEETIINDILQEVTQRIIAQISIASNS